ncbi:MAG TPA: hypothetical protein VLZ29_02235 [Sulfurimonas sp.]|jgi:hypothetical protein|uniref:hypothetical protein n=1 Tax=Sulfurimonas sp. TaxID=2022749 RepID=UPI002B9CF0B7|nr:hypothetical protein [Sulfurimonas sp.]HUH41914.1 hypothetical protein [Sulfurimonas sp.]
MWLDKLKVAIVQKDTDSISKLLDDISQIKDAKKLEELQEASYLLQEASLLLNSLKDETLNSINQTKKSIDFLGSTDIRNSKGLDIRL